MNALLVVSFFQSIIGLIHCVREVYFQYSGISLNPDAILPLRTIYFTAFDKNTKTRINHSVGELKVNVFSPPNSRSLIRGFRRVTDGGNGIYLFQSKLIGSYVDLEFQLQIGDDTIQNFIINGEFHGEHCECPIDAEKWLNAIQCTNNIEQIELDMSSFDKINVENLGEEAKSRLNGFAILHYVIKNGKLYRKSYSSIDGFKMFSDMMYLAILRRVHLPDMEFLHNLGDYPAEKRKVEQKPLPVFSWCGSDDTRDIVLPTWDVTYSTLQTMYKVSMDIESLPLHAKIPFAERNRTAFWRGRDSRNERLELARLSQRNKTVLDAGITRYFFFKDKEAELGRKSEVPFYRFFDYKYVLSLDGTVAAYRLPYLLTGGSAIFKQDSPYYEFFYRKLRPMEHYIPLKRNIEDVFEKLQWAKNNDKKVYEIGIKAKELMFENLLPQHILCYYYQVLYEYSKKQVGTVDIRPGMEEVKSDDRLDHIKCNCKPETHSEL